MLEPKKFIYDLAPAYQRFKTILELESLISEWPSIQMVRSSGFFEALLYDLNEVAFCGHFKHANPNEEHQSGLIEYTKNLGFSEYDIIVDRLKGDGYTSVELSEIENMLTENPWAVWTLDLEDNGILTLTYSGDFRILDWEKTNLDSDGKYIVKK